MRLGIIGASSEAIHTIEKAKELGIEVAAFDGNPDADGLKYADIPIVVNISNEEETISVVKNLGVDFIQTVPIGRYLTTTGAVNDALGLPGITKAMASRCTDKWLFHNELSKVGLREVNCLLIHNGELHSKLEDFNYPVILKPRYGSGSRGIVIANTRGEIDAVLADIMDEDYILEECVDGDEYGVDAMILDGRLYTILLRKKENTPFPDRQAVAYFSVDSKDEFFIQVKNYLEEIKDALELDECLLHGDIVRAKKGPFAIEISARPSGHNLHNLFTPLCSGVDMAEVYIKHRLGEKINLNLDTIKPMMIHYFDYEGVISSVPKKEDVKKVFGDRLIHWECNILTGDDLKHAGNGHALMGRGFYIIADGSVEDAIKVKNMFEII